jgi:hypothetical protein
MAKRERKQANITSHGSPLLLENLITNVVDVLLSIEEEWNPWLFRLRRVPELTLPEEIGY